MARLVLRHGPRGLEDGVPARAVIGSLSLHTAVLAFAFWGTTQLAIPTPPQVYQVELVAAPRAVPVRQVPVPERPRATQEPRAEAQRPPKETVPAVTPSTRRETPPVEPVKEEAAPDPDPVVTERAAAPPEQSPTGVEGMPVRLEGAPFPYPEYLANIILQIKRHWRPPSGARQLRAELAFSILRDGSVEDVSWIRRSGDPGFDLEARGAIEAAGKRGAFGSLPEGYPSDRLRVSFFFDPTRY
ncbi:MAG TPA: TonB C-terminal domain-containing protein [Gemmatimonadota bacterium]|nr:TonB C-terminal domain-containing protein [Gemmatimonadota bacterium]